MALDDFIDDNDDRPEDLDVKPPKGYDSWHEAEPDPDQDWHWQVTGNKTTLENSTFDGENTVLITKDIDNNSAYIASDNFVQLAPEEETN